MKKVNCAVCDSSFAISVARRGCTPATRRAGTKLKVSVVVCWKCGHLYISPRMDDEELRNYYDHHFLKDWSKPLPGTAGWEEELDAQSLRAQDKLDFLSKHLELAGLRVLHVRSETGHFLKLLGEKGAAGTGIAVEDYYANFAREVLGVDVVTTKLYEFTWPVEGSFDLIVIHHVLEHVQEPRRILEKAKLLLSPGGYIMVEEHDKLSSGLRKKGGQPHSHLFNVHLNNFTFESLKAFLIRQGLDVIAERPNVGRKRNMFFLTRPTMQSKPIGHVRLNNPWQLTSQFLAWHINGVWQYSIKGFLKRALRASTMQG